MIHHRRYDILKIYSINIANILTISKSIKLLGKTKNIFYFMEKTKQTFWSTQYYYEAPAGGFSVTFLDAQNCAWGSGFCYWSELADGYIRAVHGVYKIQVPELGMRICFPSLRKHSPRTASYRFSITFETVDYNRLQVFFLIFLEVQFFGHFT